ncbi:DUF6038 family protein [Staphylococcus chromogenes]|uniref:DUF6038 family protein n=1 Tax=Staphylococcus chromogenes TaxID=46126 RepID=UPI0023B1C3DC|nr:DUF6038 family protein [Staphylococcus chromogenes]
MKNDLNFKQLYKVHQYIEGNNSENFITYKQVEPVDFKYLNVKHKVTIYISNEPSIDEYSEYTDNKLLDFLIIDILNKLYLPSLNKRINLKIVTYNIQNNDESKIREKLRKKRKALSQRRLVKIKRAKWQVFVA